MNGWNKICWLCGKCSVAFVLFIWFEQFAARVNWFNENQHLQIWGHAPRPEKWGMASPGYKWLSCGLVHEWGMNVNSPSDYDHELWVSNSDWKNKITKTAGYLGSVIWEGFRWAIWASLGISWMPLSWGVPDMSQMHRGDRWHLLILLFYTGTFLSFPT